MARTTLILPYQTTTEFDRGSAVPAPAAPTGLTAIPGNTVIQLAWSSSLTNLIRHHIYYGTSPGITTASARIQVVPPANNYLVDGLTNGITYYFRVASVGPGGESTLSGEVSATPSAFSNTNSIQFNGVNQYTSHTSTTAWDFGTGDWCISTWVLRGATGQLDFLVAKDDNAVATNRQFYLAFLATDEVTIFYRSAAGSLVFQNTILQLTSTSDWYHILAQKRSGGFEIYVDGVSQALGALGGSHGSLTVTTTALRLGNRVAAAGYYTGYQDEISIWARSFSGAEVSSLYNSGLPVDLAGVSSFPTDCVGWWRADGSTYPTLLNSATAGGTDGSMTNMSAANLTTVVPT